MKNKCTVGENDSQKSHCGATHILATLGFWLFWAFLYENSIVEQVTLITEGCVIGS